MTLGDLKQYFQNLPEKEYRFCLSEPFSWRGSYDEVAFSIIEVISSKQDILDNIEKAFTGTFYGYKGGEYTYKDYTPVHFEEDYSSYTDGGYISQLLFKFMFEN